MYSSLKDLRYQLLNLNYWILSQKSNKLTESVCKEFKAAATTKCYLKLNRQKELGMT